MFRRNAFETWRIQEAYRWPVGVFRRARFFTSEDRAPV